MQVSVRVVANAGAYTVGADLMSAVVWVGVAGLLNVMFWALLELAAPLLALALEEPPLEVDCAAPPIPPCEDEVEDPPAPPVATDLEAERALEAELLLLVSLADEDTGATVVCWPPLLALDSEPETAPEAALEVLVCGPTVVVCGPLVLAPLELVFVWPWVWTSPCCCWAVEAASEVEVCWA
jgi:hypothetical protein